MVFAEMHRHRLLSRYDSGVLRLSVSCFFVVQYGVSARWNMNVPSMMTAGGRFGDTSRG